MSKQKISLSSHPRNYPTVNSNKKNKNHTKIPMYLPPINSYITDLTINLLATKNDRKNKTSFSVLQQKQKLPALLLTPREVGGRRRCCSWRRCQRLPAKFAHAAAPCECVLLSECVCANNNNKSLSRALFVQPVPIGNVVCSPLTSTFSLCLALSLSLCSATISPLQTQFHCQPVPHFPNTQRYPCACSLADCPFFRSLSLKSVLSRVHALALPTFASAFSLPRSHFPEQRLVPSRLCATNELC